MKLQQVKILENKQIATDIFSMTVEKDKLWVDIEFNPGQFAMIYLNTGELLLPRPISICDATSNTLHFVYQVVGAGTQIMSAVQPGEQIKILAPLGKGFKVDIQGRKIAIVGGGIGTPPLLFLAKALKSQDAEVDAYLGFRKEPILSKEFETTTDRLLIATESGDIGHRGNILEVLQSQSIQYDEIMACGPRPMLDALSKFAASQNIPCQVSMEERMACGIGTCVGCVLQVKGTYLRICTEGPVFYSNEVFKHE